MTRWLWASSLAAFLLLSAAAGPARCERTLSVNVTGVASAMPDLMFVYLRAASRDIEIGTAQEAHDQTLRKVIDALTAAGVKDDEMSAAGFAVDPITTNYGSGREYRILGYEVSTVVTVMLPFDADKPDTARGRAMKTMAAAAAAGGEAGVPSRSGGDRFECVRYGVSDPKPYQEQALELGLAQIQPKAEQMAKRLGLTLRDIQNVTYSFETRYQESSVQIWGQMAVRGGYDSRSVGPQPIEYRAQVNATYLIE